MSGAEPDGSVLRPGRVAYVLSGALALAATAAAALTVSFPSLITGVDAARGNLRGTALVVLVLGVPVLVAAMSLTARGSARALVVWLGTLGYLAYQAVLFCFATPLNNLFLIYVAYLGLAVWSVVLLLPAIDLRGFGARIARQMPARYIAAVALTVAALNAAAWLAKIIPAVFSRNPASLVNSSGLLTNPVFVQDLAIWLPLLAAAAAAGWRRRTWGLLVTGAMLVMFVLESIGISVDQWFGSQADPGSDLASASMTPVFAVIAAVVAVPLLQYCRNIDRQPREGSSQIGVFAAQVGVEGAGCRRDPAAEPSSDVMLQKLPRPAVHRGLLGVPISVA